MIAFQTKHQSIKTQQLFKQTYNLIEYYDVIFKSNTSRQQNRRTIILSLSNNNLIIVQTDVRRHLC